MDTSGEEILVEVGARYRLEGAVERVVFHNEESGYTVLEMTTDQELMTVVGEFPDIAVGETLVVTGICSSHPKYGTQLKAESYERLLPATASAIAAYLSSGVIKGVGPVIARKLVDAFGDDTLLVIEKTPQRLSEVPGISQGKAQQIAQEYQRLFGIRTVMLFLAHYNIPASYAIRTWKRFGPQAQEAITQNPYLLCEEEIGVDFQKVDLIAMENGLPTDSYDRIFAGLVHILRHNMNNNGHACLPTHKLAEVCQRLLEVEKEPIEQALREASELEGTLVWMERRSGESFVYLPECFEAERYISNKLLLMEQTQREELENGQLLLDHLETEQGIQYARLQRKAILTALTEPVMVLTGGPGTGKTTTIYAIIQLLRERGEKVALAAPTGRAAKRMSDLTGVEAKTIHRLLEVDYGSSAGNIRFKRNAQNPLPYHTIIIDECSMVDELLFDSLLRAMRHTCRLILVGDQDQLPAVGAGNVLGDLIDSGRVAVVHLDEIFRQAAQSLIVTNAHAIVSGEYPRLDIRNNDFFFLRDSSSAKILNTTADLCARRLPASYQFSPMWDIQVLCPTRVGAVGTAELNRVLQEALNPPSPGKKEFTMGTSVLREGDKVMQIRNNYDILWERPNGEDGMGIFNGDIGVIEMINKPSSSMLIRFDDRTAEYSFDMAKELELAYAITVHKSQGNEYDAVILPLMEGRSRMYYRSLLYTAVTRAKKLLIIVGSERAVYQMVDNHKKTRRYTNLVYFLGGGQ